MMAGRAAEHVMLGTISTGAVDDIQRATRREAHRHGIRHERQAGVGAVCGPAPAAPSTDAGHARQPTVAFARACRPAAPARRDGGTWRDRDRGLRASGSRTRLRHNHLGNQRREDRQEGPVRQGRRDGGISTGRTSSEMRSGASPSAGSSTIGPGQSSRQSSASGSIARSHPVQPVGGLRLGQINTATPGRVDVEERRAREQPADRCSAMGKEVHAGDQPVDEADERFAVGHVASAINKRVLAADESGGPGCAEVAGVNGHSFPDFGRQLGRRPDGHCDRVAGGDRLAQHVATQGSGRAQDQEAGHGDVHA